MEPHAVDFLSSGRMGNTSNCYHSYLTDTIYFSFSLLYFYRASGFLSPFARRKYHKVCTQFSLYLPYFLTLLIEPHATDFLSPAAWGNTPNCYHSYLTDTIYFSFSLLYFYRASGFLSPFARRKYHKVCTQFSLYLPYFFNSPYCTPCG